MRKSLHWMLMRRRSERIAVVALLAVLASCAGNRPGIALLFAADEARLDRDQQQRLIDAMSTLFPLSADGAHFRYPNCGDLEPEATPVDLNGDGVFEVFIQWGNTCTSGLTGRSLTLFVSDTNGTYQPQLGFPALGWRVLPIDGQAWPDLQFGGPGFRHAVWTWRDGAYVFKCSVTEEADNGLAAPSL